jgi:hypothetical protein
MSTNPFQTSVDLNLPVGAGGQNASFQVPAGKRLVIEYVSGEAFMPTGQKCLFSIFTSLAGQSTPTRHLLETVSFGKFGAPDYFRTAQVVRLYADPGTGVMLRADRDLTTGTATARMSLSGKLIAVP